MFQEGLEIRRALAELLGTPESYRLVGVSLDAIVFASTAAIEADLSVDLASARRRVSASHEWVELLEERQFQSEPSTWILARWWEQAAAVAQACSNADEASAALAKARHWREFETKSGEQST